MGTFELLNRLGILSIGRRPEWKTPASTGIPSTSTAGVSIAGAVKTSIWLQCREELHRKTCRQTITFDGATTYTATIGGFAVATVGNTDLATTLADIAADINADVDTSAIVTASVVGSEVVVVGDTAADYTYTVGVAGGAGTIAVTKDATDADVWVYLYADGTGTVPEGWVLAKGGFWEAVTFRGKTERLETAGYARCAVEVVADGTYQVRIGPGVME